MNSSASRPSLEEYLAMQYRLDVIADPDGGFVLEYPDLPGCMTQVESLAEVGEMAEEVRQMWLETAYDHGMDIPLPSYPESYSGKFNVRLPKSLHRRLAEGADRNGVSLNQHVVSLLSEGTALGEVLSTLKLIADAQAELRRSISDLDERVKSLSLDQSSEQSELTSEEPARAA